METKRCTKCGEVKSVEEFSINRARKGGRESWCKVCRRESARTYKAKNRAKVNLTRRNWIAANSGKSAEYSKRDRERNPESAKRRAKAGLAARRLQSKRLVSEVSDQYARQSLGIKKDEAEGQDLLLEAKRQQLLVHRALREFQKLLKEKDK